MTIDGNKVEGCVVYVLTSPDGKRYVGTTSIEPKRRWGNGKNYFAPRIKEAMEKFPWEEWKQEYIAIGVSQEEAYELEKRYIKFYETQDPDKGYNTSSGGAGASYKRSAETRKRMGDAQRGEKNHWYGIGIMKGKHFSEESKQKMRNSSPHKHPIVQFSMSGELIQNWESIAEASRRTGIPAANIQACVAGRNKSTGGCIWRYAEEVKNDLRKAE